MKEILFTNSAFLQLLFFMLPSASQMEMFPGMLKADPDFIELYYSQKQFMQLSGICISVLRISLPSIFAARMNSTILNSMKGHFRGLYLASQGSSKLFVEKLMSSDESYEPSIEPVLSFERKRQQFVCTLPLMANCRVVSSQPYNDSLDVISDSYGTTVFSARFSIGPSDASIFMCNAASGARRPLVLFVNTLPTLNELSAAIDEKTREITVRCSGVMSAIFSSVYLWELLIVSPAGSSYRLDEWSTMVYENDKPELGLMSATLTAVLPTSRIPVAAVTFYCQIVDILGQKFTQRLLPFVLESLMQLPGNIHVGMEKLSPIELLGALPNPAPVMIPLSTIFRLRCSFDSMAPQLVRIVWESYFFDPRQASYVGKRHGLDHQFILLNESLYNNGHHLCRVWLRDSDPSTSLCSEPIPRPRRPVPLCKNISADTNVTSLLTDLVAFVPLGESANSAPNRDLVVQSMTTALIVLSCVSGIFFLCLIMMIGRFHCRLRPLFRGDTKQQQQEKTAAAAVPLLGAPGDGASANAATNQSQPSVSRRDSIHASEANDQQPVFAPLPQQPQQVVRPQTVAFNHPAMSSVACEADFDKIEEDLDVSQIPLVSSENNNGVTAPPPAAVVVVKSITQSSLARRAASQTAVNAGLTTSAQPESSLSAKSLGTIPV